MFRRFRAQAGRDRSVRWEMTPMIDTVFNLLIFFAVSTTILSTKGGLRVELPKATTVEPEAVQVFVSIDRTGNIFLDNHPVGLPDLKTRIQGRTAEGKPVTVLINADRRVVYERVVEVLDTIRQTEVKDIALAVEKKVGES
jgi:biopolymer transport protein ExbD